MDPGASQLHSTRMRESALPHEPVQRLLARAAMYCGGFMYAFVVFLVSLDPLKKFPPTAENGIGRVTLDQVSKSADYVGAALFYLLVIALTIPIAKGGERWLSRMSARLRAPSDRTRLLLSLVIALPFCLAPMFYLTSRKELWGIVLPPVLGLGLSSLWVYARRNPWLRELYQRRYAGFHGLIVVSAASWLLFRYLVTGSLIAHEPTLSLEVLFIIFFVAAFDAAGVYIARLAHLAAGAAHGRVLAIYAWSLAPLILLPLPGLMMLPARPVVLAAIVACVAAAIIASRFGGIEASGRAARNTAAWAGWPWLLFAGSYASTAALAGWIDLFHRGESLGPASDFLRGKRPYTDVFILHGMLENGVLDAWLMKLFGRSVDVSITRAVAIGSLTFPAIYAVGLVLFRSLPLALLTVGIGTVTFVDNQRIVFHIVAVLFLLLAFRTARPAFSFLAGLVAAAGVFYSLDIGLYAVATVVAATLLAAWPLKLARSMAHLGWAAAGLMTGSAPFLLWLGSIGALACFFHTSFVTLPAIIDPIWSLPYPDIRGRFRRDLSLRSFTDLLLGADIRFLLNPAVITMSAIAAVSRWRRGLKDWELTALVVLTVGALIAQRSALGRADFRHQYYAAYLIAPLIMLLLLFACRRLVAVAHGAGTAFSILAMTVGAIALFVILWVPDLLNARLAETLQYRPRVSGVGWEDPQATEVSDRIAQFTRAVDQLVPRGAPIFDYSNQPALYFFADRPNPTRFYQIPIASPPAFQEEVIRDLERSRPRVVIRESPESYDRFDEIENEVRTPAIAAWIDSNYEYTKTVRGIELWTRRSRPAPATGAEVAPVLWSDEYLIFPAVGSAKGAAGSEWQSSLVAYNPDERPMPVRLRYLSGAGNREVVLHLSPRESLVIRDVVAETFRMPGTSGALLVRHPSDRSPIVSVQTQDLTRPSSLSVAQPLTSGAAADAKGGFPTLTIVGARGGDLRRVNLGLINVGQGPVHFHASFRTPDGDVIGLPAEGGIEEGERFLLVDIERPMGAPLLDGMVIHVRILEGRTIGYASVVDGNTGSSQTIVASPSVYK